MKKNKGTKRALFTSFLALLLSMSMLAGTTFAWFTDEVVSGRNTIQAGNLDVVLEYWDTVQKKYVEVDSDTKLFNDAALWEPGYTEVAYLKVSNAGSLALKYNFAVTVYNELLGKTKTGADIKLSDYLQFKVVESDKDDLVGAYDSREAAQAADADATKLQNYTGKVSPLEPKNEAGDNNYFDYVALIVYMPTTVDNKANHDGTNVPSIEMGVNLFATQLVAESDSFGPEYDKEAPIVSAPVDRPAGAVTLYGAGGVKVTLPGEVVEALPVEVDKLSLAVTEPIMDNTNNTVTFDSVEVVDQNGNVVDIAGLNLTADITVVLPVGAKFAADESVMVFHDGEYIATVVVGENGEISYPAAHLCKVEVVARNEDFVAGSGTWGGIDWVLTNDGLLVVSPTKGEPVADKNAPTKRTYEVGEWREAVVYKSNGSASAIGGYPYDVKAVKKLVIEEGVTYIGSFTAQFPNLTGEVVIPSTVTYIGQEAFHKAPITKLTFAAGGTEGLCIANGAFKKILIDEIAFPGDREYIHIHHWAFGDCPNLKTAYIPDNITKIWGGEHIDYFDNFNSQSNVTWAEYGSMFTGCSAMQTISFENETARDLFFAGRQSSDADYIMAYIGTTAYTLQGAIDAAQENDEIVVVNAQFVLKNALNFPTDKNITLNLNGKTLKLNSNNYPIDTIPANITVKN